MRRIRGRDAVYGLRNAKARGKLWQNRRQRQRRRQRQQRRQLCQKSALMLDNVQHMPALCLPLSHTRGTIGTPVWASGVASAPASGLAHPLTLCQIELFKCHRLRRIHTHTHTGTRTWAHFDNALTHTHWHTHNSQLISCCVVFTKYLPFS